MTASGPKRPNFFQSAWVVRDLETAMLRWNAMGVGPFLRVDHVQVENLAYRGQPIELDFSIALAQAGAVQVELIQQHDQTPSIYRDVFPPGEEGFHHVCALTRSFDQELARYRDEGSAAAMTGTFGGTRFAYLDTRQAIGCVTELIEDCDFIGTLFRTISDAAANWDGSTVPLRLE